MDELASISRTLRREREPALYGDEETGISPEGLYAKSDADKALKDAEKVLTLVLKLLSYRSIEHDEP
ncbi:MAG: HEPN domain-containing protein [Thermoproteota archaeon]